MGAFQKEFRSAFSKQGIAEAQYEWASPAGLTIGGKNPIYRDVSPILHRQEFMIRIRQSIAYSGKTVKSVLSHAA